MQRVLLVIAVVSAVTSGGVPVALACSCAERSFEELAADAHAIFEARVAAIEPTDGGALRAQLEVVQTWRGASSEHVEIRTAGSPAACGYPFEVGRSYLVLASRSEGGLVVSLCGGTRPMEDASDERLSLGSGVIPVDVVDEPEPEREDRPRQAVQRRGGGCAGCAVGGGPGAAGFLGALGVLGAIVARRLRIR